LELLEERALLTTVEVDVLNFRFSPIAVTIHQGDTVHWVWDTDDHSTTSVAGIAEQWNSGIQNKGATFDHTFNSVGTFAYFCKVHGFDKGNGTAGGMSGTVTVLATPTLSSIAVTPAAPSVVAGQTEQFTAMGTFSDNSTQDLTSQATWASSNTAAATVSNTAGSKGLATAVAAGNSTLSATFAGIVGSTVMTVTTPAVLQSIAVTPADPSIPIGEVQPFKATGTFSDNSTEDLTSQVIWASNNVSIASISNASISPGVATGLTTGTVTITATDNGITGSTMLTVTPVILEMIMLTPLNTSVGVGGTVQYMAMGMYSDNSMTDFTNQVTWSSSAPSVASVSDASGSKGLATGLSAGTTIITASMDGLTGGTSLTVDAPPPPPLITMTGVGIVRNKKHLVTQITVSFSGAVNMTEADSVTTYRLATAGRKGSFDAKNAGIIKLRSAVFDAAIDQEKLTPKKSFALTKPVQLRVSGLAPNGLEDTLGRLIDGNHDGQAGGNAVAVLRTHGVTMSARVVGPSGGDASVQPPALMALDPNDMMGAQTTGSAVLKHKSELD
jgi:plastocyanin